MARLLFGKTILFSIGLSLLTACGTPSGQKPGGDANMIPLSQKFDKIQAGARLIMQYDAASKSFKGMVTNTTKAPLTRVRVEIHLDNGVELGPLVKGTLAAGASTPIVLQAKGSGFSKWTPHVEVGNSESGGETGGETGGEGNGEKAREAAMSSPVTPLAQSWKGTLGGLAIVMQYDPATKSLHGTVQNTTSQKLCYVQMEPHLKSGQKTVGELGPLKLGDLNPGQKVNAKISVNSEPKLANVSFDGYVIHIELFDCNGPGPQPHTPGQGGEGGETGGETGGSGG